MGRRQIGDVDVVADRGAVGGGIVGAVDLDRVARSERGAQDARDQVGFRLVVLADLAIGIGPGGVEVAQRGVTQPIGAGVPVERPLDRQLGVAVGIERRFRGRLADRHPLGNAIHRAGR